MDGRPCRRARPLAVAAAALLAVTFASSALAGPLPGDRGAGAAPAALPPGSVETPGRNELVSTPQLAGGARSASPASQVEDLFGPPTMSADGRFVVFLQEPDPDKGNRLAVRDRRERTTTVIDGPDSNGPLRDPTISGDGRWIAYTRSIDGPSPTEVVLVARATGAEVSLPDQPKGYYFPDQPALSRDGRFLAVRMQASRGTEVLVLDRTTGRWEPVSVDVNDRPTAATSARAAQPAISADGRFVAFTALSAAAQFVATPRATSDFRQVYLRDRDAGRTTLVSITPSGQPGRGPSLNPAISGDGRVVAFPSAATDLVADGGPAQVHVYAWSAATGGVELVSRASDGSPGNSASAFPAVTADGASIAFTSQATNLVPGDTTGGPAGVIGNRDQSFLAVRNEIVVAGDVFVRSRAAARTSRVSVARNNASQANGVSTYPSISSTGRYVAFTSYATNLVAGDANKAAPDVFVRDRPPRLAAAPNPLDFGSAPVGSLGTTRPATIRSTGVTPARVGTITIGGNDAGDFIVAANACTGRTLAPGATCVVQVLFIGTASGKRTATLVIRSDAGNPLAVRLLGAVGVAKLKVEPPNGPPGIVVIAKGTGFPPNAPVTLLWSVGITATPLAPVVSDAAGAFTAQVLVLPKDRLGQRRLRAIAEVPGQLVAPVTAKFLVTASTGHPPTSGLVQVFAATPGEPIILRR